MITNGKDGRHCRICNKFHLFSEGEFRKNGSYYRTACRSCENKQRSESNANKNKAIDGSILIIPDLHAPYHHPDALDFLVEVKNVYSPKRVINLGDEVDNHAISFHPSDPDLMSPGDELEKAIEFIAKLAKEFPVMTLMDSNHGSLLYRRAKHHGIPRGMIRPYNEVLRAPGTWEWKFEEEVDGVLFCHGDGQPGNIQTAMQRNMCSIVMGHHHSKFGINYMHTRAGVFFGMQCGCLIDTDSMAFAYGKKHAARPALGCALLINGRPMLIEMKVDSNNRWIGEL